MEQKPSQETSKMDISRFRQSCRLKVRIYGEEKIVWLLLAHQTPDGLNDRPVGHKVYLDGKWYVSKDVEVLELLPWED